MIRVLIVEDDPMVAELNKGYLNQMEGFQWIGTISDGLKALDFLTKNQVDLILLDVFMPQMNGMELLEKIRSDRRSIDIIMITAARSSEDIQNMLRQGVVDYVIKPFEFQRFQSALISYRERVRILSQSTPLDQSALDKKILIHEKNVPGPPKGIEPHTLRRIKDIINERKEPFSLQELSPIVGLSRISLKKYLDHLKEEGMILSTLTYRSVGRPVRIYSKINKLKNPE